MLRALFEAIEAGMRLVTVLYSRLQLTGAVLVLLALVGLVVLIRRWRRKRRARAE